MKLGTPGLEASPCTCCGEVILTFVGGSMPEHGLCEDCGRGKCTRCIDQVRVIWKREPVTTECPTCWRSHGCSLPEGHPGDDYSHVCEPCPEGCTEPDLEGWPDAWSDSAGRCSVHCGDRPISGDMLFDVRPGESTNERRLL